MAQRRINANLMQGYAAELRVASELAFRGFHPLMPGIDYGYDIMIEGGCRIQVKSTHLVARSGMPPAYWFGMKSHPVAKNTKTIRVQDDIVYSERCDFVVLFGITEQRFWVVPAMELDHCRLLYISSYDSEFTHHVTPQQVQELTEQGLTPKEIGAKLGCHPLSVSRFLRGEVPSESRVRARRVRQYEGRWDQLDDFASVVKHGIFERQENDQMKESLLSSDFAIEGELHAE